MEAIATFNGSDEVKVAWDIDDVNELPNVSAKVDQAIEDNGFIDNYIAMTTLPSFVVWPYYNDKLEITEDSEDPYTITFELTSIPTLI